MHYPAVSGGIKKYIYENLPQSANIPMLMNKISCLKLRTAAAREVVSSLPQTTNVVANNRL
jgi:hypothetical protein